MDTKHRNNKALKKLGKHIRALREVTGHSQESFARLAKLDRAYYGSVERGEVNISVLKLINIAKAMKVSVKELIPKEM